MYKALSVVGGNAEGQIAVLSEGISFWGGVDPQSGRIIDIHHPQNDLLLSGLILLMPTTRGSCSGSGVILELILENRAPAALVFCENEDVATLGAIVASEMFDRQLPVLRVPRDAYDALAKARKVRITAEAIISDDLTIEITQALDAGLSLSKSDRDMLAGKAGKAVAQAMRILVAMAQQQGATNLIDISKAHIDGCIYAGPAYLIFAEAMERMGASVRVPTTMNAISVDRQNWQQQGVATGFGEAASRLADAYVRMGCQATFTCAPYLLEDAPQQGSCVGWSESNAVIFANSVLGARTAKHPDFLDLCIALTGRAPLVGPFHDDQRRAGRIIDVEMPQGADRAVWPLIGYLAGLEAPDCIPLLRGLASAKPDSDDLKALCAAFGTTSAAPMLHIEGITPEADKAAMPGATAATLSLADLAEGWRRLNSGPEKIDLVAIGSPHASLAECHNLVDALGAAKRFPDVFLIVTTSRQVLAQAIDDGTLTALQEFGAQIVPDVCWCTITRPVFPVSANAVITTSAKYAHYGPGLSGCAVRLGTLSDCVEAATLGRVPARLPPWLERHDV